MRELSRIHHVIEAIEIPESPPRLLGEVTDPAAGILDRERIFVERHLVPLRACPPRNSDRLVFECAARTGAGEFAPAQSGCLPMRAGKSVARPIADA